MRDLLRGCALAALACVTAVGTPHGHAAVAEAPLPIDYWAIRDSVTNVTVSPDGRWLALMKIESKDGAPIVEVYDLSDLSSPYKRLGASKMEFLPIGGLTWLGDDRLFMVAWDQVRRSVKGPEEDVYDYKTLTYDISEDEFEEFEGNYSLVSTLPTRPDKVLVEKGKSVAGALSDDPFENFRPREYYELDLERGTRKLVFQGTLEYPQVVFDTDGNVRFSEGFEQATDEVKFAYRSVGDKSWKVLKEVEFKDLDMEGLAPVAFAEDGSDRGVVLARNGHDLVGLWAYDFAANEFGELLFRPEDADVTGVLFDQDRFDGVDRVVAATYPGAKVERHFFDEEEEAFYEMLESVIPNAHQVGIEAGSRDGDVRIIFNQGPKDPGTYYLLRDGQLAMLGSQNPLLSADDLHRVEYVKYQARDGRTIPAYVTYPDGEAPYPLVVMPHGGPYVTEVVGYDEWAQFLADQGYMVLQPQYRGSTGYGYDHFISSYDQHGLAMQDDKDDGALHLVREGLVDPERIAMYGWSYGGYAAGVAAAREDQIYQCVIPGAAVLDPWISYNGRRNPYIKYADDFSAQRGSRSGISPLAEVANVNVPVLLIHGDVDHRVLFEHYEVYKKALEKNGKDAQYVVLEDAGHFYHTLRYEHQKELYENLQRFLKEDCGPNGL